MTTPEELRAAGIGSLDPFEESEAGREHEAQKTEERRRRGEPHGISAEDVAYCDANGYDLRRFAALRHVRTIEDWHRMNEELAREGKAREQAKLDEAVARAKKEL